MNMNVRPLMNEADLDWALVEIEAYFARQPEPGSPEAARFSVLAALIENYEDKHWPVNRLVARRCGRRSKSYTVHPKQLGSVPEMVRDRAA